MSTDFFARPPTPAPFAQQKRQAQRPAARLKPENRRSLLAGLRRCRNRSRLRPRQHRLAIRCPVVKHSQSQRSHHENHRRPSRQPRQHVGRRSRSKCGLRTLPAERPCQVSRLALLKKYNPNQEQAHENMDHDHEVEKNLHCLSCFPSLARLARRRFWCGGGDLNPYALWAPAPQAGASANFATSA